MDLDTVRGTGVEPQAKVLADPEEAFTVCVHQRGVDGEPGGRVRSARGVVLGGVLDEDRQRAQAGVLHDERGLSLGLLGEEAQHVTAGGVEVAGRHLGAMNQIKVS